MIKLPTIISYLTQNGLEADLFGTASTGISEAPKTSTKDSIMALFGGQPQQAQPAQFGVPGKPHDCPCATLVSRADTCTHIPLICRDLE